MEQSIGDAYFDLMLLRADSPMAVEEAEFHAGRFSIKRTNSPS